MISSSVNAIVYYNGFIITTKHGLTSVSGSPKIVQLNNKMSLDALKQAIGNKISIQNEFTTCHPSSTTNQNSMQNQEIQEVTESTQQAFKILEIQVGKLVEEVTKFVARREENSVKVEAHEESLVEEHDSKEKR
ncbi:hypothetical protein GmHk_11G032153 [Glycine max]|nr:hypothetical protein GmHk_11G032153 [Glycine max]